MVERHTGLNDNKIFKYVLQSEQSLNSSIDNRGVEVSLPSNSYHLLSVAYVNKELVMYVVVSTDPLFSGFSDTTTLHVELLITGNRTREYAEYLGTVVIPLDDQDYVYHVYIVG